MFFRANAKLLKNPKRKKYAQYSENFKATLFFLGKRKLLKNREL